MIFFKSGYARVPKVLEVTGLLKDWDAKSQSFRVGSFEATTKNKILFDLRTQYLHIADKWEAEERNWSPVQLAHALDEVKTIKSEVKVVDKCFLLVSDINKSSIQGRKNLLHLSEIYITYRKAVTLAGLLVELDQPVVFHQCYRDFR